MDWFEQLTGFREASWHDTRQRLVLDGRHLVSQADGRRLPVGEFEMASLQTLRERARNAPGFGRGRLQLSVVRGDVRELHCDPAHAGSVFQVASQFNMLEMVSPQVSPEDGITRYASDRTQGPACAMAAGSATLYRNHFVEVDRERGQTRERQLDGLRDVGAALALAIGTPVETLWTMRNGYAMCHEDGLRRINALLSRAPDTALDHLRGLLQIGVHRDVPVTWGAKWAGPTPPALHTVTQAFCSALPVAYGEPPPDMWAPLATLVLEAAYEATLWEAVHRPIRSARPVVHLTLLGGGAFGNEEAWILTALRRALTLAWDCALDVRLVSYDGRVSGRAQALVDEFLA